MLKVYVKNTESKGLDDRYHHYYTRESELDFDGFTEHFEMLNSDATYTCTGDYMVGRCIAPVQSLVEVSPHECSVGVVFREHNMVVSVPSGSDHVEGGVEYVEFVVDAPIEIGKPFHVPNDWLPKGLQNG